MAFAWWKNDWYDEDISINEKDSSNKEEDNETFEYNGKIYKTKGERDYARYMHEKRL